MVAQDKQFSESFGDIDFTWRGAGFNPLRPTDMGTGESHST